MGGTFTDKLTKKNTHLICLRHEGLKYEKAREWKVKIVSIQWLQNCFKAVSACVSQYFIQFSKGKLLSEHESFTDEHIAANDSIVLEHADNQDLLHRSFKINDRKDAPKEIFLLPSQEKDTIVRDKLDDVLNQHQSKVDTAVLSYDTERSLADLPLTDSTPQNICGIDKISFLKEVSPVADQNKDRRLSSISTTSYSGTPLEKVMERNLEKALVNTKFVQQTKSTVLEGVRLCISSKLKVFKIYD